MPRMWRALACSGLVAAAVAVGAAEMPRADDPDHFTPADKQAMLAVARRIAASRDGVPFDPATMPAKLLRSTGQPLILSIHEPGREPLFAASAAEGTIFEQIAAAARRLRAAAPPAKLPAARLKLDLVTAVEPLGLGGEPVLGIEGIRLRTPWEELLLPPSEALRLNLPGGAAFVRHALSRVRVTNDGVRDLQLERRAVQIERFAAVSFIERDPGGGGPPVDLCRGMPLVEEVTRGQLLAAAEAAGDYLLRAQKPDGSFHYLYDAAKDRVDGEGYEITRHAGTAWSLAQLYGATGRRRFGDGARRALEWLLGRLRTRGELAWLEHDGEG